MKKIYTIALALLLGASTSVYAQKNVYLSTVSKMDFAKVTETTSSVYLNRSFFAGYNTICLPFSVNATELKTLVGEGVMLEKLAKVDGNTLSFIDVTNEGIEAGMPYLIYSPKQQTVKFASSDKNLVTTPITLKVGEVTMKGNYVTTQQDGLYGIPAQQNVDILESVLIRTEGDKNFLPTRCGIEYASCTSTPTIKHVTSLNEATAISRLMETNAKVSIYTTSGQLVKKGVCINDASNVLAPGIYVVNGQKMIIK